MERLNFETKIIDLLDEACSKLNNQEFEILLERVTEAINDYE